MKKFIATRYILLYLLIFFAFKFAFDFINPYYLQDRCATPYPIDVRTVETNKWADTEYLVQAKHAGYNHQRYYFSFFPADLVFPLFYTALFLSSLLYCRVHKLRNILTLFVVAGLLADWSEDVSFAIFLGTAGDGISPVVAFFTTVKTVLFILNIMVSIFFLTKGFINWLADAIPCPEP